MIRELQDELPDIVFMREALRKVKEPHQMTHEDFDKQCKEMTIKARQLAVESNKTYLARKGLSRSDRKETNKPDSKETNKSDRTDVAADTTDTETDATAAADHNHNTQPIPKSHLAAEECHRKAKTFMNTPTNAAKPTTNALTASVATALSVPMMLETATTSPNTSRMVGMLARKYGLTALLLKHRRRTPPPESLRIWRLAQPRPWANWRPRPDALSIESMENLTATGRMPWALKALKIWRNWRLLSNALSIKKFNRAT